MIGVGVVSKDGILVRLAGAAIDRVNQDHPHVRCRLIAVTSVEAVVRAQGIHLLLIDCAAFRTPGDGTDVRIVPRGLTTIVRRAPLVPVAIWGPAGWLHPRRVLALAATGVREVILQNEEDQPAFVADLITGLVNSRRAELLIKALPSSVPDDITEYLAAMTVPTDEMSPPTPHSMAQALGGDRATIYRRFAAAGLPPPSQMVGWVRVYLVFCLIEEGISMERAAFTAGFGSVPNFLAMAQRRTGLRISGRESVVTLGSRGVLECLARERASGAA